MEWLGVARVNFHHAAQTVAIPRRVSPGEDDGEKTIELSSLCKAVTQPCHLNPFLFNGHLQTMWTAVKSEAASVCYRRRVFKSEDRIYPGTFTVDFVSDEPGQKQPGDDDLLYDGVTNYSEDEWSTISRGSEDSRPMLIALHGLSGGSHELYLRHVLVQLLYNGKQHIRSDSERTWEACVINARGCARSKVTSSVLFNARATWDVRQLVKWLRGTYPNRPLFAAGFSLGGNILVNYLGEEGDRCELVAAIVCSNPWNLEVGSLSLQRTWLGREVYSKTMGGSMKKLFEAHIDQISKNPGIDVAEVRRSKYLHEFDRAVQCPSWGWPTEGAYYRDASSTDPLLAVRIPLFAIHAEDDPVAPREALPFIELKQNPYAVLCTTSLGGHLSWFQLGGGRWYVHPIVNFLNKMAEESDIELLGGKLSQPDGITGARGNDPVFDPLRRKLHVAG